ncbi:acyltransferase family protein [Streptomyces melanogenes]|uniref:acyltransferase family protein n=1 Tax=Streptomyces melanogenes TaxID=67326 RepID=UPI001E3C2501|nr:acyltransferase [Streptomyces melanogenes]
MKSVPEGNPLDMPDQARTALLQPEPAITTTGAPQRTGSTAGGSRPSRIYALDGLRLLAALTVVMFHYMALTGRWPGSDSRARFPATYPVAAYGWLGVQLFFLISGFVICMSSWGKPLQSFFVSRVVRLYPAYWFAVIATTLVLALNPHGLSPLSLSDVITNLTMFQEPMGVENVDSVYWTLFAELRFYLLFAVVAWRGLTYRRLLFFCCAWAVASALVHQSDSGTLRMIVMPDNSWCFIAGVAFYLMYRFRPNLMLTGIVLFCLAASLPGVHSTWEHAQERLAHPVPYWPVIVVMAACFGVMGLVATGKLSWIQWRWLPYAGALTYPLYLLHEYIGWEIIGSLSPHVKPVPLVSGVIALMLALSWLVHRYVERPLGKRLKQGLQKL